MNNTSGNKYIELPNNTWRGAGVAIPVFSLRSKKGWGTGEFSDIKLLVDWCQATGLKLIQLLPINDTNATGTYLDSYPYAAISAFALNPIYINLQQVAGEKQAAYINKIKYSQKLLNQSKTLQYEEVLQHKLNTLQELYVLDDKSFLKEEGYTKFFKQNKHWLIPYAAYCSLKEKYATADTTKWQTHSEYNKAAIEKYVSPQQKHFDNIAIHYFIQYHLHLQLKEASDYARQQGVLLKGDIAIGVARYGCDVWAEPNLFKINMQAGAPPDQFTSKGQNWNFPTYNWEYMEKDNYTWWHTRLQQMSHYFDAIRIDHLLGFFRMWSIPFPEIDALSGYFEPRDENLWEAAGTKRLWALKNATSMLFCGEDLGIIPSFVPRVMDRLGIISLNIQRWSKQMGVEFSQPSNASYLSVVTPSTHDMSTIRAWWEEDKAIIQRFYNYELNQSGDAPYFCEPWVVTTIILQHLHSPAILSIFLWQDLMGMDGKLRYEIPREERINEPANPHHNWCYRMHISLEDLLKEKEFNKKLKQYIEESGRGVRK